MSELRSTASRHLAAAALALALLWAPLGVRARMSDFSGGGYVKDLLSHTDQATPDPVAAPGDWRNTVQLRLDLEWYPTATLTAALGGRSLLESQRNIGRGTWYANQIDPGAGLYFDLEATSRRDNTILASAVDRLWVDWTYQSLEMTAGRQRIAWGTCLVWNPTDLFNPFSVLDFDYAEKPGADALRIQVYTGAVSKVELAAGPGRKRENVTYGMRCLRGLWGYDASFLAGWQRQFWRLGAAWSGQIASGGFRGEVLYSDPGATIVLDPRAGSGPAGDFWTLVLSYDYTFRNSFYVNSEVLYNGLGSTGLAGARQEATLITGELSPARYSIFQELAYDFMPLLRGRVFGIFNPDDRSWVSMLSLDYSVATDWELLLFAFPAGGSTGSEFGDLPEEAGIRIRYDF